MPTIDPLVLFATAAVAALSCFAILWILLRTGWAWEIAIDIPNLRSLHARPVPRVGGWGALPTELAIMVMESRALVWIAFGAFALAVVSQIDDRRDLPARARFAAHTAVATLAVASGAMSLPVWLFVLLVIAIVWFVNLSNFMDGSNGLAGGMAAFGFATYAVAAASADPQLAVAATAVAGAALGFLGLNFHPARIFLGDVGSIPLGFLAGAFGFWGWRHAIWPIWLPVVVFAPFVADSTVTLLRRLARGEKFWQAHREHFYQRLVHMGSSHVKVALAYYGLMLASACVALLALQLACILQWLLVGSWYIVLAVLGWRVECRWRQFCARRR
jgi:UDP-N-acetylmuramyl pentapeptide phosphotransferase/UDP-N-acetylglucosamine-1-phosphate transferase